MSMGNKKVAILQSNYIPWKGYFDLINMVDEFIVYDDVQYTKNDWRNRNRIKTRNGIEWITIPVYNAALGQKIRDTKIADSKWNRKHWKKLQVNYARSASFEELKDDIEEKYMKIDCVFLTDINLSFIQFINSILGIKTKISFSSDYDYKGNNKNERLVDLLKSSKADIYYSGPSAKDYIDEELFNNENIEIQWMDYSGYPEYKQLYPPFEHGVSIIDLIFNTGINASKYMKSFC
mgnify:CR=1 FL=1